MDNIIDRIKSADGHIGFYYKNLITNEQLGFNENDVFDAASVIKLPMFAEIYRQVHAGKLDLREKIKVRNSDKMPSCGALNSFTDEPEVDIETLCNLMITLSDNTATNVLINRLGIDTYNKGFDEMGLEKTRIRRLLFDAEGARRGLENCFCPLEIASLLESLYHGTFVNEEVSGKMIETLCRQQINHKIPGNIGEDVKIAHKTGEDDGITHDCGIVYARNPFIVIFASNETNVPEFEKIIRETSYELYKEAGSV